MGRRWRGPVPRALAYARLRLSGHADASPAAPTCPLSPGSGRTDSGLRGSAFLTWFGTAFNRMDCAECLARRGRRRLCADGPGRGAPGAGYRAPLVMAPEFASVFRGMELQAVHSLDLRGDRALLPPDNEVARFCCRWPVRLCSFRGRDLAGWRDLPLQYLRRARRVSLDGLECAAFSCRPNACSSAFFWFFGFGVLVEGLRCRTQSAVAHGDVFVVEYIRNRRAGDAHGSASILLAGICHDRDPGDGGVVAILQGPGRVARLRLAPPCFSAWHRSRPSNWGSGCAWCALCRDKNKYQRGNLIKLNDAAARAAPPLRGVGSGRCPNPFGPPIRDAAASLVRE